MDEREISEEKLNEVRFVNLIRMLSEGVMMHLGKIANPLTGEVERNLEAAKETIDTIRMLKEKTKGNLSEDESNFLLGILSNLQLNYVDELKKGGEMGKDGEEKERKIKGDT